MEEKYENAIKKTFVNSKQSAYLSDRLLERKRCPEKLSLDEDQGCPEDIQYNGENF